MSEVSETRDTLRCFYPPKERTVDEATRLQSRVDELEIETMELTKRLAEREDELLDALNWLEEAELL